MYAVGREEFQRVSVDDLVGPAAFVHQVMVKKAVGSRGFPRWWGHRRSSGSRWWASVQDGRPVAAGEQAAAVAQGEVDGASLGVASRLRGGEVEDFRLAAEDGGDDAACRRRGGGPLPR